MTFFYPDLAKRSDQVDEKPPLLTEHRKWSQKSRAALATFKGEKLLNVCAAV